MAKLAGPHGAATPLLIVAVMTRFRVNGPCMRCWSAIETEPDRRGREPIRHLVEGTVIPAAAASILYFGEPAARLFGWLNRF